MTLATVPPEISSARMYTGPGSGSMAEAATAWDRLAVRLYTTLADYRAVTAKLPVTALIQAAAPYIDWLNAAAAQAQHAATQVAAAVSAHQKARAAMVPPALIEENRAQRRSLALANCLGQASPALAAAEACYEQMWAQNCHAMYAYAGAAANASTITAFTSPPGPPGTVAPRCWALTAAPDVISAGRQVMSAIPEALQVLSASPLGTCEGALWPVTLPLSKLSSLSAPSDFAISHLSFLNKAAALRSLLPSPGGATVTAGFGRATPIAKLSVPQAWTKATPSRDKSASRQLRQG